MKDKVFMFLEFVLMSTLSFHMKVLQPYYYWVLELKVHVFSHYQISLCFIVLFFVVSLLLTRYCPPVLHFRFLLSLFIIF